MGKTKVVQKVLNFSLESNNIHIKNLLQKDFIEIEVWAISDAYPNNNISHFPYKTLVRNIKNGNFYNKPVLGYWNNITSNYEVHNGSEEDKALYDPEYDIDYYDYSDGERPIGFIRKDDNIRIEEKDGLHWVVFSAIIWVKYNYNGVKQLLKSKTKKVSAEVSIYKYHTDDKGIEIYDDWSFDGVTILGYLPNTKIQAHEGIEGAHMNISEKINTIFSHDIKQLQFAYKKYYETQKGEKNLLTYEMKRDLLTRALKAEIDLDDGEYCYVLDLDEEIVYFNLNGETFSAPYTIGEDEESAKINMDYKKKAVSGWKTFVNNYKCVVNKQDCEFSIDGESCSFMIGDKKCSMEEFIETFLNMQSQYSDCQSELEACKGKYADCQSELEACQGKYADCKSQLEACNKTFSIDDSEINAEELFDKYTQLKADFSDYKTNSIVQMNDKDYSASEIKEEYDKIFVENETLKKNIFDMKVADITFKVKNLAAHEKLTKEQLDAILDDCQQGKYQNFEEAKKDVAYASFLNREHSQKTGAFQILDHSTTSQVQEVQPFEKLQNFINK